MKIVVAIFCTLALVAVTALALVYSGTFNVAAKEPDSAAMHWLMKTVRHRSIESRSAEISVPPLDDPALLAVGAEHYEEMCVGCHLAPGMADTELRAGLNPKPPALAKHAADDAAETFWVIKNGVRMTGMPAWGVTHDDRKIWALTAFVQRLPGMSADEYRRLTGGESDEHRHAHDDTASTGRPPVTDAPPTDRPPAEPE